MSDSQASNDLEIGQIFEGKYRIMRELGRGGFGMVYLAYQELMDRHVALKVLRPGISLTAPSAKERFLREVRIISKLKHPNTVTIHDFGETIEGGLYMTLEFVEGETLKQILKREGPQPAARSADLARQIARSLSEAHRHGVVHRDLKPANIMTTNIEGEKDFVKVLDFGVARLLDPKTSDLTSVGLPDGERELIGTPRYMSPEQVRGESLTGSSDIYSLGLILYEMLTGEPAVQGDTTMGLITQQISPEPLRMPLLHACDPRLQDIIRIATAKPVQDRFQTADQVADALEEIVSLYKSGVSGSQSNEVLMSYQSQLMGMHPQQAPQGVQGGAWPQPQQGGWQPQQAPWGPQQSGWQPQQQPYDQYGNPQSGYHEHPSGPHPQYQTVPPGQMQGVGPHSGPHQTVPPQQQAPYPGPQSGQHPQFQGHNQTPSGQHHPQGIGEIPLDDKMNDFQRNSDFEDFQPTVERGSLDPSDLKPFSSQEAPSFSDLPPPPADERPFAPEPEAEIEPEPEKLERPEKPRQPVVRDEDDLLTFSLDIVKILTLFSVAGVVGYVLFLIVGAAIGKYVDGTWRLVGSAVLVGLIPLVTAIGESSQRERFRVVERTTDRLQRILLGSLVFFIASGIIVSTVAVDNIVRNLRTSPNWFLSENAPPTKFRSMNRDLSHSLSNLVGSGMAAVGLYDERRGPIKPVVPESTRPPAPTRNAPEKKDAPPLLEEPEDAPPEADAPRAVENQKPQKKKSKREDKPAKKDESEGGGYIKW